MRAFEGGFGEEDAVVREDADRLAVDGGEAGEEGGAVEGFEFREGGAVDEAGDEFVGGEGGAEVGADEAGEVGGGVEGFFPRGRGGGEGVLRPVEVGDAAAGEDEGMRVRDGEVVGYAGDGAVEVAAAEVFAGDDFAGGGFDEGRAGEEDGALVLDDDGFVGHGGDVGAAGGAGAHYYGYLGDGEG